MSITAARLAELAGFCSVMAEVRRGGQPWADLAAVCRELAEVRRLMREGEEYYSALLPVMQSGSLEEIDRMLEMGRKVGR